MAFTGKETHWLDRYGSKEYQWQAFDQNSRTIFCRPIGLVEFTFDADGRYCEGRADMNAQLDLEIKSSLSDEDFRERILFAWTCVRCKHLLLQAKAISAQRLYGRETLAGSNICFAVESPRTITQAIEDAGQHLVFLYDHYHHVDPADFWVHCQNASRVLNPDRALAKMFVYTLEPLDNGHSTLRFLKVGAHEIVDGLSAYTYARDFIYFLNQSVPEQRRSLRELLEPNALLSRLPPPQEALYTPISGNRARQRWFWLLTRILRHVRRPLQAGFANPLLRRKPRKEAIPLSPSYSAILDYSRVPPLNSYPLFAVARNTQRLHRLCREAKASIGAGCFALAALIMMEMYEQREPNVPLEERPPFISGFPINPRAFYNHKTEPDSLMLAFCDGISFPFLPSDLDFDGRLRLLAKQAHRQLAVFQKRSNPSLDDGGLQYMSSGGAGRILATQYIMGIERMELRIPDHLRRGVNPQGRYPTRPNLSMQTCGVSSVGNRERMIQRGRYDLNDESKDFVADYRRLYTTVRPRDEEFLVGIGGDEDGLYVNGSIDGNAMDPILVEQWRVRFENILGEDENLRASRL